MKPEELEPIPRMILSLLRAEHVGRDRAVKRAWLLGRVRRVYPHLADNEMRIMKEQLIEVGFPICSGPEGWWYAASLADAELGATFYEQLGKDQLRKARLIRDASARLFGPQLGLPGMEA
jgi:hypothetical protein